MTVADTERFKSAVRSRRPADAAGAITYQAQTNVSNGRIQATACYDRHGADQRRHELTRLERSRLRRASVRSTSIYPA